MTRALGVAMGLLAAASIGCGGDEGIFDLDKLCARGAGIAARISGTPQPMDVCIPNDHAVAIYTSPANRYHLSGTSASDSLEITIEISFFVHRIQPRDLNITSDSTRAFSDPDGAWFFYREIKPGVYDYSTSSVTGDFRLSITDQSIATGTFTNLRIELEQTADGTPAGSRMISEGFFAVTADKPRDPLR